MSRYNVAIYIGITRVYMLFACTRQLQSPVAADTQKAARAEAKKRIDRADLYTDNWGGDKWKGGKVNVLSIILAVSVLVPLGGLLFAYLTFGTLWG